MTHNLEGQKKYITQMNEKIMQYTSKKTRLDVGGKIFSCSIETLCKEESFFSAMFSGRHTLEVDKFDGSYFIDRNPFYFEIILDYLRTGKVNLDRLSSEDMLELIEEVDFYQIQSLKTLLVPQFTWLNGTDTLTKTGSNLWDYIGISSETYSSGVHNFLIKINYCHTDRSGFVLGIYGDPDIGPGMYQSICGIGLNASTFSSFQLLDQNKLRATNIFDMILDCDNKTIQLLSEGVLLGRGSFNDMLNRFGSVGIAVFLYYIGNSITITKKGPGFRSKKDQDLD